MKILQLPNSCLREKTKTVENITPKIRKIIKEMITTLKEQKDPQGVGLAAPQVGIPLKIFLINPPKGKLEVVINPKIKEKKGRYEEKEGMLEGCLSLHGYYGHVKRANEVKIFYRTVEKGNLKSVTQTFTGFPAVIIQHEMDHLEGKLFIDRILEDKGKLYKIGLDDKNKEILEEVKI